jgi:hypothetical protein
VNSIWEGGVVGCCLMDNPLVLVKEFSHSGIWPENNNFVSPLTKSIFALITLLHHSS